MQPSVANASNRCNDAAQRCKRISPLRFCHVVGARIARPPIFCKLSIFPPQRPPSSREGDRPQTVEGVSSRRKAYSFPKSKFMRQNAEPCAGLRRILLNFIFNSVRSVNSLPFSGGNIRPERMKFNKSNSPLAPPLTALKFLNIHALFFRNSLDFAVCHRLQ